MFLVGVTWLYGWDLGGWDLVFLVDVTWSYGWDLGGWDLVFWVGLSHRWVGGT